MAHNMTYYIGQALGIVATICCFALPLFKKKWQMLLVSATSNVFFVLNLLLIDQFGSASYVNIVAIVQTLFSLWHVQKDKPVTVVENILFLIAYVVCGSFGFKGALDLLPIAGSVFNMLSVFQRDEQKTRILILFNASLFCIYYIVIGSTNLLAELLAVITTIIAMVRYRKKS